MKNLLFRTFLVISGAALAATPVAAQQRGSVPQQAPHTVNPSMSHHVTNKLAGHPARATHTGAKPHRSP
jgi:hypothetical protein